MKNDEDRRNREKKEKKLGILISNHEMDSWIFLDL